MKHLLFSLKDYYTPNGFNIEKHILTSEPYSMHFHDYVEVSLLAQGTGMQNINGTEYHMPTYTLTVMHNYDCHRYYDMSSDNILYNLSLFSSLLPDELLKKLNNLPFDKICVLPEHVGKTALAIMDSLVYLQEHHKDFPANFAPPLCQSLIEIFLHHYVSHTSTTSNTSGDILQNSLIYINEHYTTALSLNEIAEYSKCCPTYLSEYFHKKMGLPIKQYINVMRLKHAKKLLISSDLPIMSICFECGFSSLASFNRNFLANEKISPSAYRKTYNSNTYPDNA
jgi:AraC-like DNA-binding protein